jgi:hypothetical protein
MRRGCLSVPFNKDAKHKAYCIPVSEKEVTLQYSCLKKILRQF